VRNTLLKKIEEILKVLNIDSIDNSIKNALYYILYSVYVLGFSKSKNFDSKTD